jgi:hypothetical protein
MPGHQLALQGLDEFEVELRPDQRAGGVAHADQVGAGLHLRAGEAQRHGDDEGQQVADKGRVVEEIQHEGVEAAQIGAHGAGAFYPPLDQLLAAHALAKQAHGLHAVAHARGDGGIGQRQARQGGFFGEQGAAFDDGGRLVIEPLDGRPEIGGLASGVGDGRDVIQAEFFGGMYLGLAHHAMVAGVIAVTRAGLIGGEHHGDGHEREVVRLAACEQGQDTFAAGHSAGSLAITSPS